MSLASSSSPLLVVLAAAAALNYADRAALSAVLPELQREFALTDVQLGLFGSVFLWCYALGSPLAGAWADRQPRHRIVILSIALWSGVTLLTGLATGFASVLGLRGALGLAECLYLPAATALIATHHSSATRGRAMSIHSVGLNCGVVIDGECTVPEMGQRIFEQILRHASGEQTKSELLGLGDHEFVPWHMGIVS